MKKPSLKNISLFSNEKEESAFWDKADSTQYFSGKGKIHLKLPRRTASISLRLPIQLLQRLKRLAQLKDVPYQSLLKIYLDEKICDEIAGLKRVV